MKAIADSIHAVVVELYPEITAPVISVNRPDPQFGDFATNIALQLAKPLDKNPREVAEKVAGKLREQGVFKEVSIAGPGFINVRLSDSALFQLLDETPAQVYAGQTVVAEYSDPNPFKVLHAGHLYTTLIGDAISKLYEVAGAHVHRVNFGGDVGLHVGRTMWAILRELGGEYPDKLADVDPGKRLEWLSALYVIGSTVYEDDEMAKSEIIELNKKVYQLHSDEDKSSPLAQIYWTCRQWSYEGFDALYEKLKISPFEKYYPESETSEKGVETVRAGLEQGIFEESDGAVVYKGEKEGLHTRVFLTSSGLPTYETKDLGCALHKWEDYQFDHSVIITGDDIIVYMKVVLVALGHFHPEAAARTKHITHGQIKLAGGVKMSSRKGNILRADDVLESAATAQKQSNDNEDYDVVLAAVKYAFMKQRIGGNIIYDPVESVSIHGDSGPYLQYAHARACSILEKAEGRNTEKRHIDELDASERVLVVKLGEYTEAVDRAVADLMPHHICTYLYELAQEFNRFYESSRIIDDQREAFRLTLVGAYAATLRRGLTLLNIPAPEKM